MIKISEVKLYKVGEVVKILKENFKYETNNQILCRKAVTLNAYVTYNRIRYIPEDIICNLTTNIRKRDIKKNIEEIIEKKRENIIERIRIYDQRYGIPPIIAIKNIKSHSPNTNTIVQAILQLKEEISKQQEEISKQQEEISKQQEEIQKIQEELKEKNKEITKQQEEIQKIQEELKEKNKEITKQQEEIQNIKKQSQETIQINMLKEVKATLNHLVYKESNKN
ncbi:hypothetical protein bcCo53_001650 (plasmid) [Borrelia coriaceae]|nr:hypothetical protein [Borrelia coriaceae]UPA17446.1 hypothetical protein bcCo53_001650 [Borrelia coriaceae]